MTTMHITHRQEAFSLAYVRAVAATAGFRVQDGTQPDDDSVDLTIAARGPGGTVRSPRLDLQLKCQLGRPADEPTWPYDLKAKNYEDLRHTDLQVPRILVVVAVPDDVNTWLEQDEERLLMRHCGWWVSLRGLAASTNTNTVRVQVPRAQRFDVAGLTAIMARLGQGGVP
ncbi:DUF4365 domain-containing protein [Myxococcota bacterium]|nr:DUF4365 domain-containing protein [Myxococcota bacterium]